MNLNEILIVDNDSSLMDVLRDIFSKEGFSVRFAGNGSDAIAMMNDNPSEIVLLELELPGMNGLEVLSELSTKQPESKVIVMTGFGTQLGRIAASRLGAEHWLSKPLDIENVLNTIREIMKSDDSLK